MFYTVCIPVLYFWDYFYNMYIMVTNRFYAKKCQMNIFPAEVWLSFLFLVTVWRVFNVNGIDYQNLKVKSFLNKISSVFRDEWFFQAIFCLYAKKPLRINWI